MFFGIICYCELSRAALAPYNSCGDRYRPLSSSHWPSRWSSAGLTTATVCWLGYCQLDPAPSVGSKRCNMADFWPSPWPVLNTVTNAVASFHWLRVPERILFKVAIPSSEWQCSSVPVVLLHPSRWRAISIETLIIHIRRTDCSVLQLRCCRQVGLSSLRRQSLEQSLCTSHLTTIAHRLFRQPLKTFLFRRFYPDLIIWHSEFTFRRGCTSNCANQARLKVLFMTMMIQHVTYILHRVKFSASEVL